VSVQNTGHGAEATIESGVLITTAHLDQLGIDPAARTATIGAGVRWDAVVEAAAAYGLAPVSGSSPEVGAVGLVTGGGVGPLARSQGYSSDYVLGFTVVTGDGTVVEADADENPDLYWGLRGGKFGLGVVTAMRVRLVELTSVYGGSFFVDTPDIERMLRSWVDWTGGADDRVTTSAQIVRFPDLASVPQPMRGRCLLGVRFAFAGDTDEGVRLAAPLRSAAPVYLDLLGELPVTQLGLIHNDPTDPLPAYVHGTMLERPDQGWVTALLDLAGPDVTGPTFMASEIRHLGAATHRDVPGGSAVGGREPDFAVALVGVRPDQSDGTLPALGGRWDQTAQPWISAENNINVMSQPATEERIAACWPDDIRERLGQVRARYDPAGLTAGWWIR
jgi:hypothetical protein